MNKSNTEFECICVLGWTNKNCEKKVNFCENVTCQNNAVCRPLFRDYKCECLSTSYSGRYCEIISTSLVVRKIVSKSVGYIAIICVLIVIGLVVTLDVLKYVFHIDPVRDEGERLRGKKQVVKKRTQPHIAIRYEYVN